MNRGAQGEQLALAHYQKDGYRLVAANYRTREGEIDLIVERDGLLVFSEVKTRARDAIATPAEWVDAKKQKKIQKTALYYLAEQKQGDIPLRFDVVEVVVNKENDFTINRIENAF